MIVSLIAGNKPAKGYKSNWILKLRETVRPMVSLLFYLCIVNYEHSDYDTIIMYDQNNIY